MRQKGLKFSDRSHRTARPQQWRARASTSAWAPAQSAHAMRTVPAEIPALRLRQHQCGSLGWWCRNRRRPRENQDRIRAASGSVRIRRNREPLGRPSTSSVANPPPPGLDSTGSQTQAMKSAASACIDRVAAITQDGRPGLCGQCVPCSDPRLSHSWRPLGLERQWRTIQQRQPDRAPLPAPAHRHDRQSGRSSR
jgi:hypothetical protein